jgi:hypothetical protein
MLDGNHMLDITEQADTVQQSQSRVNVQPEVIGTIHDLPGCTLKMAARSRTDHRCCRKALLNSGISIKRMHQVQAHTK